MEKRNKILITLIIVLSLLVVGLGGFIVYDKILSGHKNVNNDNSSNDKIDNDGVDNLYSYNDFSETVFSGNDGNNYLILWKNGTYSYNNTIGNYIIKDNNIILNYIFNNGKVVGEESQIMLEIISLNELEDTKTNIKLNKVNHPTSPGGNDFYHNINLYKYESISQDNIQVDYSKLTDMGTGINIKNIDGYYYQLTISAKGEISYLNKNDGKEGKINVMNVVDVQYHQSAGDNNGQYFILTKEGELYKITEKNMNSNDFKPVKDNELGKVIMIGEFNTCKPGAGCGWGIYCLTVDGKTKQLAFSSV